MSRLKKSGFIAAIGSIVLVPLAANTVLGPERTRTELNLLKDRFVKWVSYQSPQAQLAGLESDLSHADEDLAAAYRSAAEVSERIAQDEVTLDAEDKETARLENMLATLIDDLENNPAAETFRYEGKNHRRADIVADIAMKTTLYKAQRDKCKSLRDTIARNMETRVSIEQEIVDHDKTKAGLNAERAKLHHLLRGIDESMETSTPGYLASAETKLKELKADIAVRVRMKNRIHSRPYGIDPTKPQLDGSATNEVEVIKNGRQVLPNAASPSAGISLRSMDPVGSKNLTAPVAATSSESIPITGSGPPAGEYRFDDLAPVSLKADPSDFHGRRKQEADVALIHYYVAKGNPAPKIIWQ